MSEDLCNALSHPLSQAFSELGLDPALGMLRPADRPDLADFQCNGALAAAKAARVNPRELAGKLAALICDHPSYADVAVAGPGFINIRVTTEALAARVAQIAKSEQLGASQVAKARRVVVDFAGPNVAKPMHVGHLRSSIIGESIKRLFRFRGDSVVGDAHFGDWGFQMGLLITAVEDAQPGLPYHDENWQGAYPQTSPVSIADLERLYPQAASAAKEDEAFRDRARRATAQLQAGRAGYRALWQHFVQVSRQALTRDFAALGVTFDLWNGESDADPLIADMVANLQSRALAVEDQGAMVIHVAQDEDKRRLPPLLLVSSEGASMYGTTDLATILQRRQDQDFDLCLYCVDQRQSDHFTQVFRAACQAGYATAEQLEHVANGTMNGEDGRPFKTRAGGVLKLDDLIQMTREKAAQRLKEAGLGGELDEQDFAATAHKVAVAALKFADLSNHRQTSYVFDLERFTSFEGKTGPYLLYQVVRIKSLLRRAKTAQISAKSGLLEAPAEREMSLALDAFTAIVNDAYTRRAPNLLAEHAYRLAQSFSRFYAACPILGTQEAPARLFLAETTLRQLTCSLDLLGIEAPSKM